MLGTTFLCFFNEVCCDKQQILRQIGVTPSQFVANDVLIMVEFDILTHYFSEMTTIDRNSC